MTIIGSHIVITNRMSCSMMTKVMSRATLATMMFRAKSCNRVRFTPAPGSSSSTSRGSAIRVRPSSSSFFWPPDRLPAYSLAKWEKLRSSSTSSALASMRRSSWATLRGMSQDAQMRSPD